MNQWQNNILQCFIRHDCSFYGESLVATGASVLLPIQNSFSYSVCNPPVAFCVAKAAGKNCTINFLQKQKFSFAFFLVSSQKSLMTWLTLWTRLTAGFVMRHRGWSWWRPSRPPVVSLSPDALRSSPIMSNKSRLLISWKNQLMFFHCCVFPKKLRLFCQVLLVFFFKHCLFLSVLISKLLLHDLPSLVLLKLVKRLMFMELRVRVMTTGWTVKVFGTCEHQI